MPTRTELEQAMGARRVVAALVLAVALLGGWTTASAGKPRGAASTPQPDAGGFQLTEKVRIPADVRADYDNATRLLEAKQYDQGIALLLKVTQKAPNATAAYVDLGIAYGKSGDLDKAVASLKRAVELNPRQLVAYNELGMIYRRKGEFAAARENYDRNCADCHGANGDGQGSKAHGLWKTPTDFQHSQETRRESDGELYWSITRGSWPMPAFDQRLSDTDRWQLVNFLRTFARN